jgi:hypothetical protein
MKTEYIKSLLGTALLAVAVVSTDIRPLQLMGTDLAESGKLAVSQPVARKYPFRGTVHSVDPDQGQVLLSGRKSSRVLKVTSETVLEKGGRMVTLSDIQEGDQVKGTLTKDADGAEVLVKGTFEKL